LKQHKNNEGPFSPNTNTAKARSIGKDSSSGEKAVAWTSRKKRSPAWYLLYKLRLFPDKSGISTMTQREIWQSSDLFTCYPFQDFKKYDDAMTKLTEVRRERIRQERRVFECDMANFPPSERTIRGEPFWNRHAAQKMLKEDVESGVADMKPSVLWRSRPEYMDFQQHTFSRHVHQEKSKQRAAPYWQVKCQKIGRKLRKEQAEESKRCWIENKFEADLEDLIYNFGRAKASYNVHRQYVNM
jgi:hypothetical protein